MMNPTSNEHDGTVWDRLVDAHSAYLAASRDFYSEGVDRARFVREALKAGRDRQTACLVLKQMNAEELQGLFDVLVDWASTGHGLVHVFQEAIFSLPRDWVLARVEEAAEPYLQDGTDDEYRRFLELYCHLDRHLALKLAQRAAAHSDEDIQEAGTDFLEKPADDRDVPKEPPHVGDRGTKNPSLGIRNQK